MLKISLILRNLKTLRINTSNILKTRKRNLLGIVFVWKETHREVFKPALVYLQNRKTTFKHFQYFYFETTGVPLLSSKIRNETFPFKTFLSKTNGKTIKMGSTIWTYHKERGSRRTSNYSNQHFFFLGIGYILSKLRFEEPLL